MSMSISTLMNASVRAFYRVIARAKGLFGFSNTDDDIAREMAEHLDMATDENIRRGMSPEEARRVALMESGGIELAKEAYRDQRTMPRTEGVLRDLKFAWRGLRRSPGYAIPVIVSLTLGIGLNTAIFTMTSDVLRRPLPFFNESELVTVGQLASKTKAEAGQGKAYWTMFDQDIKPWMSSNRTLESVAAFESWSRVIEGPGGAEYATGGLVTPNLLRVLGTQPIKGRWFRDNEVRERVAVLSYELWQRQFALDANVVGQILKIDGEAHTIVGVMPRTGAMPLDAQYWIPAAVSSGQVIARPRAGMPRAAIVADLERLSPGVANLKKAGYGVQLIVVPLHEQLFGSARPALRLLTAAAALLFLIACANIANLSLARTLERRRELAVRVTLGADRKSLATLVLSENFLLALFGAAAGLAFAEAASKILLAIAPRDMVRVSSVHVNASAALFAFALAVLSAAAVSLIPVLSITSVRSQPMLGQHAIAAGRGRRLQRVRQALVTTQIALTLLLLTGGGLLIRSVAALTQADHLGFTASGVAIANISLFGAHYRIPGSREAVTQALTDRLRALPGVQYVAIGPAPLVAGNSAQGYSQGFDRIFSYADSSKTGTPFVDVWVKHVDADYLQTFRIRMRAGRGFLASDNAAGVPVVMINSSAARLYFPNQNPIGHRLEPRMLRVEDANSPTVIGVVDDVLQRDLAVEPTPEILIPSAQRPASPSLNVAVRTASSMAATIVAIRQALREVDPALAATRLEPMNSVVDASLARHTFLLSLLITFAALALVLSVVGLYAIVSYLVSQRRMEIGVRLALGAQRYQVFGLVLGEGAVLVFAGVLIGTVSVLALGQLFKAFLFGVQPRDPLTLASGPIVLALVALLATYLPALRAARLDPAITLRAD